jgi:M6 family metalloprotease-like protein
LAFFLTPDQGEVIPLTLSDELVEAHGGFVSWNERRVAVWLQAAASRSEGTSREVAALQLLPQRQEQPGQGLTGSQPWVSILCKFSDLSTEPKSKSYFQDMYGNRAGQLDHYWREVSYGQIDLAGSLAIDWVTLPRPQRDYVPTPGSGNKADLNALFADCTAAADPFVDFSRGGQPFVGINMMFNGDLDCCAWGGSRSATLDGVSHTWRVTWAAPQSYANVAVIAHEMGHGFGLPHSNNADRDNTPYDSPWDVMSDANEYTVGDTTFGRRGKHTIAHHKDLLGWIPRAQQYVAMAPGNHQVTIDALTLPSATHYRMVRIPIGTGPEYYTVEVRYAEGNYDAQLPATAVILHHVQPGRREPAWVIGTDNPPATYSDGPGVIFNVGKSFTDLDNKITVTVVAATPGGFQVEITNGMAQGLLFADGFENGDTSRWSQVEP